MLRMVAVAVLLSSSSVLAADAAPAASPAQPLDKAVPVELGDLAANYINAFFASRVVASDFDAPVLARYDPKSKKVIVLIFGSRSNVEGARETLGNFLQILKSLSTDLEKTRGVRLDDSNSTAVYLVKTGSGASAGMREVVRREDGKFITP